MENDYQKKEKEELEYRMNATVGTEFIIYAGGWYMRAPKLKKVERATKTQLVIDGTKYNRERGREVGRDSFNASSISMPTEELIAKAERGVLVDTALSISFKVIKALETLCKDCFAKVSDVKSVINLEKEFLESLEAIKKIN